MRKRGIIEITLQSDLCVGSGYSYAGIIDCDICYDANGIPYIPAKRLKGCLRETAEQLLYAIISEEDRSYIFGEAGSKGTKGIILENAYLKGYEELRKETENLFQMFPDYIQPQNVLEQFTHVKAQTKLKDGIADDTTLRFTRVVNQYAPDHTEMKFAAEVFFEENAENTIENKLSKIVKATRNIGLMRNRGMGSVKCELCDVTEVISERNTIQAEENAEYVISYVITNTEPLMLSSGGDNRSEKYISGQKVLGLLAKNYLEKEGNTAEDEAFMDLFLNGRTIFSHAYPYKDGKRYCPAPEYLNRLKKTKQLVNTYFIYDEKKDDKSCNPEKGNQPKKLKGKFVAKEKNGIAETDVDMSIIYHHSHTGESRGGDEGILYSVEAIQEWQMFSGHIYVSGKYLALLLELFTMGELRFGKSITAQYGKCRLTEQPIYKRWNAEKRYLKAGTDIVVRFLSDTIFVDGKTGDYSVYSDTISKLAAEQLGIKDKTGDCPYHAMLRTKMLLGYQSVWNLRKQPIPAIEAGGCLVYRLKEDAVIEKTFLGERNLEGFGEISIEVLSGQQYTVKEADFERKVIKMDKAENVLAQRILQNVSMESMMNQLCSKTMSENELQISKAALGRVTLMLRESLEEKKDNPKEAFREFVKRVQSIKTTAVRQEVEKNILKKIADDNKKENGTTTWTLKELPGFEQLDIQKKMLALIGWDENKCRQELNKKWGEFLLLILIQQKYLKKK